ncbi:hypothetical protein CKM354_000038700 [Cercospora kikuchii]|uniref:Uncharacterized protein n=1 Tax=Cercospora kikuchii TaxID=84275 RepID=A0A9P3C8W1_9PEZI|nr:uncharacterized protein CKM354_000038700 [Cercospora kikuchii]GIZ36921.1 hypothetical protein CKM354_000038700 [Cercospora kikuchii]
MFQLALVFLLFAGILSQAAALPFLNSTALHNCSDSAQSHTILRRADLKISDKGLCGGNTGQTCMDSLFGDACGQWGYCGSYYNAAYAGAGCQEEFGRCNEELNATAPITNTTTMSANASMPFTPTGVIITPISVITVPITTTVEVVKTITVKEAKPTGS